MLDAGVHVFEPGARLRELVERSRLPISDGDWLQTMPAGRVAGQPWRVTPISYTHAPRLAHFLHTACFIVVAYLSGMRVGEVLNLERGCVQQDPVTGLWSITGRYWKGAVDHNGDRIPEGEQRRDPWTTVEQAASAINVLQRLHRHQMLFPDSCIPAPRSVFAPVNALVRPETRERSATTSRPSSTGSTATAPPPGCLTRSPPTHAAGSPRRGSAGP
jgi:integrase